jgi:hypothetical protein
MDLVYLQYSVILVRIAHFDFIVEKYTGGSTILAIPVLKKNLGTIYTLCHNKSQPNRQ